MDRTVRTYFSSFVLCLALVQSFAGATSELEYISPTKSQALAEQFASAKLSTQDEANLKQSGKPWLCDMYGVRSRLQVQHGLALYKWSKANQQNMWKNSGAQLLSDYQKTHNELIGKSARLTDEVKITSQGQLISRLSLSSSPNEVIAYSLCQRSL